MARTERDLAEHVNRSIDKVEGYAKAGEWSEATIGVVAIATFFTAGILGMPECAAKPRPNQAATMGMVSVAALALAIGKHDVKAVVEAATAMKARSFAAARMVP